MLELKFNARQKRRPVYPNHRTEPSTVQCYIVDDIVVKEMSCEFKQSFKKYELRFNNTLLN